MIEPVGQRVLFRMCAPGSDPATFEAEWEVYLCDANSSSEPTLIGVNADSPQFDLYPVAGGALFDAGEYLVWVPPSGPVQSVARGDVYEYYGSRGNLAFVFLYDIAETGLFEFDAATLAMRRLHPPLEGDSPECRVHSIESGGWFAFSIDRPGYFEDQRMIVLGQVGSTNIVQLPPLPKRSFQAGILHDLNASGELILTLAPFDHQREAITYWAAAAHGRYEEIARTVNPMNYVLPSSSSRLFWDGPLARDDAKGRPRRGLYSRGRDSGSDIRAHDIESCDILHSSPHRIWWRSADSALRNVLPEGGPVRTHLEDGLFQVWLDRGRLFCSSSSALFVEDANGSQPIRLTASGRWDGLSSFKFARNGSNIVYVASAGLQAIEAPFAFTPLTASSAPPEPPALTLPSATPPVHRPGSSAWSFHLMCTEL